MLLEGWGAACRRAARCASPRRRPDRRAGSRGTIERAIAPETARPGPVDPPRELATLYSMPRAYWTGSRRATSHGPCWLAAGGELEDPRRASLSLAGPPARPRPQARKASFLAFLPSANMPKDTSQRPRRDQSRTSRRRESSRSTSAPSTRPPGAAEPTAAPWHTTSTFLCGNYSHQKKSQTRRALAPTANGKARPEDVASETILHALEPFLAVLRSRARRWCTRGGGGAAAAALARDSAAQVDSQPQPLPAVLLVRDDARRSLAAAAAALAWRPPL